MTERYEQPAVEAPHRLTLDGRRRLSLDGVRDVESFDENTIVLHTARGTLVIRGEGLQLQSLSLEGGQVAVDGTVDALIYEDAERNEGGFLRRLFG
ncbi:MAG: sporulation protein YabP [Oscillospiraceae bacterium]|nr:sporulation protein YabP [Oscillospiraceae bacterium]